MHRGAAFNALSATGGARAGLGSLGSAVTPDPVRIAIVDDDTSFRELLDFYLTSCGFSVALRLGVDLASASDLLYAQVPVAVLGLEESGANAAAPLQALDRLVAASPEIRWLVLARNALPEVVARCFERGACGFLVKLRIGLAELRAGVEAIARGERLVPASLVAVTSAPPSARSQCLAALTQREREVLACIASGFDNLKISAVLAMSERTARAHVSALYRKLGGENRAQLALLARELGVRPRAELQARRSG